MHMRGSRQASQRPLGIIDADNTSPHVATDAFLDISPLLIPSDENPTPCDSLSDYYSRDSKESRVKTLTPAASFGLGVLFFNVYAKTSSGPRKKLLCLLTPFHR